jgi:hypothetical protein
MRPNETVLRRKVKWELKRMMEVVNLAKIYCHTFVNAAMYPQYNNNMIIKIKLNLKINISIYIRCYVCSNCCLLLNNYFCNKSHIAK